MKADNARLNPRKRFATELREAAIRANLVVARRLFDRTGGEGQSAVTACIFWLKTRAGWRESPQAHDLTGANGGPIQTQPVDLSHVSDEDLELLAEIAERTERAAKLQ